MANDGAKNLVRLMPEYGTLQASLISGLYATRRS
jgi:hypothetical protein